MSSPEATLPAGTTASAKCLQARRRDARQKQAVYQVLMSLAPPFGAAAESQYRQLSAWWSQPNQPPVAPTATPGSAQPAAGDPAATPHAAQPVGGDPAGTPHGTKPAAGGPVATAGAAQPAAGGPASTARAAQPAAGGDPATTPRAAGTPRAAAPVGVPISHAEGPPCLVDWSLMPPSCDPVALLDNKHNTTRRKGVPVDQQVTMLEFTLPASGGTFPAAASTTTSASEGAFPAAPTTTTTTTTTTDSGAMGAGTGANGSQGVPLEARQPPVVAASGGGGQAEEGGAVASRGQQKRWQVETFAAVLKVLLGEAPSQPGPTPGPAPALHVVDFGSGTGGLLLPLAHMFPHCIFTGVEMKKPALAILHQRATMAQLLNVRCHHGMIEQYNGPVDMALALHACGNATDHVMLLAQQRRAAFMVSPCCVGKLKFSLEGGSSFSPHIRTWHALLPAQPDSATTPSPSQPCDTASPGDPRPSDAAPPSTTLAGHTGDVCETDRRVGKGEDGGVGGAEGLNGAVAALQALCHPRSEALQAALLAVAADPHKTFRLMASVADTNFLHSEAAPVRAPGVPRQQTLGLPGADQEQAVAPSVDASIQEQTGVASASQEQAVAPSASAGSQEQPGASGATSASTQADQEDPRVLARCCKLHIELDRREAAREAGFLCALYRVLHAGSTAKGDVLVGVPAERHCWKGAHGHLARFMDF